MNPESIQLSSRARALVGLLEALAFTVGAAGGGTVVGWGGNQYGQSTPSARDVVAIAAGSLNWDGTRDLALKPDGTVVAWNSAGNYTQVPAGWTNIVAISAGWGELLGLKADGTVVGWPGGLCGGPPASADLTNVVAICASSGNDRHISLALKAEGTVVGWGFNFYGGPFVPPGLTNVVAVASGSSHSLALVGDGPPVSRAPLLSPRWNVGRFGASLPTQSGRVYRLEYKTSLTDGNWVALPLVAGNGAVRELTDPTATGAQRFYRVRRW